VGGGSAPLGAVDRRLLAIGLRPRAVPQRGPAVDGRPSFLFANPASAKREKLTIRLSLDDCKTWPRSRVLHPGPSAYSDLALLGDHTILCLYERGEKSPSERITLARLRVADLKP